MRACPSCGAELETPLGCGACGALLEPESEPTPFDVLGLEVRYDVDPAELSRRRRRIGRLVHPDFHATGGSEARALAERNGARLNDAYEILADDARRADWIVKARGGPSEKDERQMPQEFLMEVLEWNETLEAARKGAPGSDERSALETLERALEAERARTLATLAGELEPTPDSGAPVLVTARKRLNALRYIDRTLSEIRTLRLEQAASR